MISVQQKLLYKIPTLVFLLLLSEKKKHGSAKQDMEFSSD
jgi:hypothetical protein